MTSLANFSTLSRLVFPPAAAHKAQVSGGNLIRLNLPSRTGLGRTTLSWQIPTAQFQGPFHISRPVTDTLHISVPTSLFVRLGCYHQVPETGWFKQKTRISHSSGGWEAQDPGCQLIWFLVKVLFLTRRCCLLGSVHTHLRTLA